jgi:hypothetical protein
MCRCASRSERTWSTSARWSTPSDCDADAAVARSRLPRGGAGRPASFRGGVDGGVGAVLPSPSYTPSDRVVCRRAPEQLFRNDFAARA